MPGLCIRTHIGDGDEQGAGAKGTEYVWFFFLVLVGDPKARAAQKDRNKSVACTQARPWILLCFSTRSLRACCNNILLGGGEAKGKIRQHDNAETRLETPLVPRAQNSRE